MSITEDNLLKNGYLFFEEEHHNHCSKFYQKSLKNSELNKHINVYYYVIFDGSKIVSDYEFELVEEHDKYWSKKYLYSIDDEMTIEDIEKELLGD